MGWAAAQAIRKKVLAAAGVDSTKLFFGRKVFGQTFILEF
jgi:hypothetical protein